MSMNHVTSVDILAQVETHLISTNALQELKQEERNQLREVQMQKKRKCEEESGNVE